MAFANIPITPAMEGFTDITPPSNPISLAREMVDRASGARAGIAVLICKDGSMWFDCCGEERAYVMWALRRMEHELLTAED